jgi:hypothetical protein
MPRTALGVRGTVGAMAAPRRSEGEAREKLLAAGRRLLIAHYTEAPERLHEGLRGVLTAQAIAAEAGYSSHAVVYRLWGDDGDALGQFAADVAASMPIEVHGGQLLIEAAVALRREGLSWEEALRLMAEHELARLGGDENGAWTAWIGLAPYAFGGALQERWHTGDIARAWEGLEVFYATALTLWGRRMRPGLSEHDLVRAMSSTLDGFLLDHRLRGDATVPLDGVAPTPEGGHWTRWTLACRGVFEAFTEEAPEG